jgi:hypothetical protein
MKAASSERTPFHRSSEPDGSTLTVHCWAVQTPLGCAGASKEAFMTVIWDDLTEDEQTALKRMNRGPYPSLSKDLAERLVFLGLAEERPGGTGISRAGRELVIGTLLGDRRD